MGILSVLLLCKLCESLRSDDAFFSIKMPLDSALCAADSITFLPKAMGGVPWMSLGVGLIYTVAGDELPEGCFIDTFVDVDATFSALEVARGLSNSSGVGACCCCWCSRSLSP